VRGVEIPKPGGGKRQLGIPTVKDRLVQQAVLQSLEPRLDPEFSESSYGFRPGRSAHDALKAGSATVEEGCGIVVDLDLEKFFDRVNHDILMSRLARRIEDKSLLRLTRRFLEAGMMQNGVRAKVMKSVTRFLEKRLKLKVNRDKSAVAPVEERKFLGYRILETGTLVVAPESLEKVKRKVREITRRSRGIPLERMISELNALVRGWVGYFQLAKVKGKMTELDGWTLRRLGRRRERISTRKGRKLQPCRDC